MIHVALWPEQSPLCQLFPGSGSRPFREVGSVLPQNSERLQQELQTWGLSGPKKHVMNMTCDRESCEVSIRRHHARRSPMGTEQAEQLRDKPAGDFVLQPHTATKALGAAKDLPLALERHYDLLGLRPGTRCPTMDRMGAHPQVLGTPPPDVHAAYKRLGKTLGDEDRENHHTASVVT